ncbi:GFA family protein [Aestuariibius sp. HNIBRBA575]|uniref:GFA family protein n=1 Tax=Aestuariibius sp. HNIBRBA575 TaxID=3233343 RepID=UPI0034A1DEB1
MSNPITGQCLCGQVTYSVSGSPKIVAQCHCDECRKLSGTGHAVGAMFAVQDVDILGETQSFQYTSAHGSQVTKVFCPTCSSPIYGKNSNLSDHMTLTLGTMNEPVDLNVQVVIFGRDKPHWDQVDPDVMSFDTQPDWTPPDQNAE